MKFQKVVILSCVLLLFFETVASTIITSTLFTGFVGGFLMGKITLGTLLAIMNAINGGRPALTRPVATSVATQAPAVKTRFNPSYLSEETEAFDIPNSVENEVRDRFLKQLGKMDPLNCLPKVFCEVSADPKSSSNIFGNDILGFSFAQQALTQPTPKPKTKRKIRKPHKKHHSTSTDNDQPSDDVGDDDNENDDGNSGSSEEEEDDQDEPYDDKAEKMKEYEEKERQAIESKALEELIDEFDDPINYYYILKDKKKNIHPAISHMMKDADLSRSSGPQKPFESDSFFGKKMGTSLPQEPAKSTDRSDKRTTDSIDDIFADDPFFDDFSRSLKFPDKDASKGMINVGILRRNRRNTFGTEEDDITMGKYKLAGQVAEMKDPRKCRRVFSTCPFTAEEVLSMISKLNADDSKSTFTYTVTKKNKNKNKYKTSKQDDGMKNLQNTLMAIEKLNDATLLADATGEQVDYRRVVQDAKKSHVPGAGSKKILEDFEQIEEQLNLKLNKRSGGGTSKKSTKSGKGKKKSKGSIRKRRNGGTEPRLRRILQVPAGMEHRMARIVVENQGKLYLSDRDDEFFVRPEELLSTRARKYSDEDSFDESEEDAELISPNSNSNAFIGKDKIVPVLSKNGQTKISHDTTRRVYDEEDDEVSSPESEEKIVDVPSFSQAFVDTLQRPSKYKTKPRPIHAVVKVKPQTLRSTTPKPKPVSTTVKPRKPIPTLAIKQKFSVDVEDDEEDAKISEKHVDDLVSNVSKYSKTTKKEPKPKKP